MKHLLISAAAVALIAGTARAADIPLYEPPPVVEAVPVVSDWSGFYIGAHGGYAWGDAEYDFDTNGWYNLAAGDSFSHEVDGFVAGGHIGGNWQWNSVVLGLEASGTWSDIEGSAISPYFPASDAFETEVEWYTALTPRLGLAFDRFHVYAKGGVAFAEINTRAVDNVTLGGDYVEAEETEVGWTVGGGAEFKLAQHWLLGVEGNYYDFEEVEVDQQVRLTGTNALVPGLFTDHNVGVDFGTVVGRVSYMFGGVN